MNKKEYIAYKLKKMKGENKPIKQKVAIAYSMAKQKGFK